jgi:hypothetical protein
MRRVIGTLAITSTPATASADHVKWLTALAPS